MLSFISAPIGAALYRLRGGLWRDLTGAQAWYNGTHAMRAIWAIPTALLVFLHAGDGKWWLVPALAAAVWASLALWGHGAHMIFGDYKQWLAFGSKTENLTDWWLPQVFGGTPDATWPERKITAYQLAGMSFIGFVRHLTMIAPIANTHELRAIAFSLLGLLHGYLYWASWKFGFKSQGGEVLVGALMWGSIVAVL